jgi:hypothetical protein
MNETFGWSLSFKPVTIADAPEAGQDILRFFVSPPSNLEDIKAGKSRIIKAKRRSSARTRRSFSRFASLAVAEYLRKCDCRFIFRRDDLASPARSSLFQYMTSDHRVAGSSPAACKSSLIAGKGMPAAAPSDRASRHFLTDPANAGSG